MTFDEFIGKIREVNPDVKNQDVVNWLTDKGITVNEATADDALQAADDLSKTAALATTGKNKGGMSKGSKQTQQATQLSGDREQRTQSPNREALQGVSIEMDAFEDAIVEKIDQYVQGRGDRVISSVLEAPNKFVAHVQNGIAGAGANPDHFRTAGNGLASAIFGDL